jgi:hypothetical protein
MSGQLAQKKPTALLEQWAFLLDFVLLGLFFRIDPDLHALQHLNILVG